MTTQSISTEEGSSQSLELQRLANQLSDYGAAYIESRGRANLLRKERDAERSANEKLRKEVDKLSNRLLCERMRVSSLEKDGKKLNKSAEDLINKGIINIVSQSKTGS